MPRRPRVCAVCGASCRAKRVYEQDTRYGVICMACGPQWTFASDGKPRPIHPDPATGRPYDLTKLAPCLATREGWDYDPLA